jgi:ATP-dependent Lon protease
LEQKFQNTQRNFILNEQYKIIKKELGLEKDEKEDIGQRFEKKLVGKTLSTEADKVFKEELEKLSHLDPSSSEYNVTRNYLDWIT